MNRRLSPGLVALTLAFAPAAASARDAAPADVEFFEKKVRPVLVEHCYKCHSASSKTPKGGLRVDTRAALLAGGDGGPALVPGHPEKSKLVEAVRYQNADLLMPPKAKLPDAVLADLERWVKMGAPWPKEDAPKAAANKDAFDLARRKSEHWSWAPVRDKPPPAVRDASWPRGAIDRFLLARLEAKGLRPAEPADRRTLLRRLSFDLVGLPPSPEEIDAFLADQAPDAVAKVVERLLARRQFGERWARHWLDLVRYAETRGHEFDPVIPNAWQYRDYVIRALNDDVPYDQFALEHLAGDLLETPRRNRAEGFNESILGTGFWFLGEEVHSPVDVRQDQADRFDNRIDVMAKTFLGLTVACARCHDHKFDAVSQKDYYALFGLLEGSSYRQVPFDTLEHNRRGAAELWQARRRGREEIRRALAKTVRAVARRLPALTDDDKKDLAKAMCQRVAAPRAEDVVVDFASAAWLPDGFAFGEGPARAGDVALEGEPASPSIRLAERTAAVYDRAWDGLRAAPGAEKEPSALASLPFRPGRTLRTPTFPLTTGRLFYLVKGAGGVYASVGAHTMIAGPLHGQLVLSLPPSPEFRWVAHDLTRYKGLSTHVEFTPAPGSDFAVAQVVQADAPPTLADAPVGDETAWVRLLDEAARRLDDGTFAASPHAADAARLVNWFAARPELLGEEGRALTATASALLSEEKKIVAGIRPESRLALALLDGNGVDERVFVRGSPRVLGEAVPRRFLEALAGPGPLPSSHGSGRLELARQVTDPRVNPFLPRVLVNRVWHHLFGRGLVGSVDNFGVLGEEPTHPELLDHLASRFVAEGWSLKRLVRELVLSRAYAMSSHPTPEAEEADPRNLLLHRARLRRLEGEAIRDALLAVSGRLDTTTYGPPVPIHLTPFLDGRGRPGSGPLDGNGRRSLYLAVKRNFLSPLLLAFDTPSPFSTVGRRSVSNVPAQALILLNDPFVHQQAEAWARRVLGRPGTTEGRVRGMYLSAFGREPTESERTACLAFLERQGVARDDVKAWADLAHTLFNVKEFLFLS